MKVGISTATFFLKELTENCFSVIRLCEGECCEVFLTTFCEYEEDFGLLLKDRLNGLEVYSVHSLNTNFEPQLFNPAPRTRADAEKIFRKVCRVGQILGAKVYTFHGQPRLKKNAYFDPVVVGKRMFELGEIAKEYGITLCLENVHWAVFNEPAFFAECKKYCPNCGVVLDIKQAWQSGYDWREYLDVMGDMLKNVHLSDHKDGKICMVGDGEFPFEELVERLNKMNYQGPLLIEQYAKDYDDYSQVKKSVEYLKTIIGGINNAN
ncbi:MAG: sugar phosphate isomerase/epimerase [Clostridia bacterium]|nr:sugar phosphate isomerase/epimerase [Clostridia bacterium]